MRNLENIDYNVLGTVRLKFSTRSVSSMFSTGWREKVFCLRVFKGSELRKL